MDNWKGYKSPFRRPGHKYIKTTIGTASKSMSPWPAMTVSNQFRHLSVFIQLQQVRQ